MLYYTNMEYTNNVYVGRRDGVIIYREPDNTNHSIQNKINF